MVIKILDVNIRRRNHPARLRPSEFHNSIIILKISVCHLLPSWCVAKSIMSAICCGTMVNSADGYGVTMFMFRFATASLAVRASLFCLSQASVSQPTAPLLCPICVRDAPCLTVTFYPRLKLKAFKLCAKHYQLCLQN